MNRDPILRVGTKVLVGPILLFGLYVQFHGDFGPGGGFQAGVIIAAAFILHSLIFGLKEGRRIISQSLNMWIMILGVLLYGGVGIVSIILGEEFLSYNILGSTPQSGQHVGILLVEFGVGLTVSNVMIALFNAFVGFKSGKDK